VKGYLKDIKLSWFISPIGPYQYLSKISQVQAEVLKEHFGEAEYQAMGKRQFVSFLFLMGQLALLGIGIFYFVQWLHG
jgi:hypothetical protein